MKFEIKQILFSVSLLLLFGLSATAQEQKISPEILTVNYCELIEKPTFYDKKIVRVTANYLVAFEGSMMSDSSCDGKDTWVEFDAQSKDATNRKVWKKFDRLTDTSPEHKNGGISYPSREVKVTWIGLFHGVRRTELFGKRTVPIGYGHMNAFNFQLTVQKIENVSKLASN